MKNSIILKVLALMLAACALVTAAASGLGILLLSADRLYQITDEEYLSDIYHSQATTIAWNYAGRYAAANLGQCPESVLNYLYGDCPETGEGYQVLLQHNEETLAGTKVVGDGITCTITPNLQYPVAIRQNSGQEIPEGGLQQTEPVLVWEQGQLVTYDLYYYPAPNYTVSVYMEPSMIADDDVVLLMTLYSYRFDLILWLGVSLAAFSLCFVYLLWSAGKATDGTLRPRGLNRMPLDVYGILTLIALFLLIVLGTHIFQWSNGQLNPGSVTLMGITALTGALIALGWCLAFAAQVKMKGGYWWRHSFIGWCIQKLGQGSLFVLRVMRGMIGLLPLIWQLLLAELVMTLSIMVVLLFLVNSKSYQFFWLIVLLATLTGCAAVICYFAYGFGMLMKGAKKMSQGELEHKIPTQYLMGHFRDFAEQMNTLSAAAMLSAQKEMRSERMKSELITNVSHDIKTPLTSIINFVDLLQKPHTPEQETEYLEVLSRQSGRMKRLIDDLMELSKANTGNLTVNITPLDPEEAIHQAIGEFSDKLDGAQLQPILRKPEVPMTVLADGRLMWRVLSNLLSNTVKYAMPGTRLYIDLTQEKNKMQLSLKNISKEPLNTSAEDLLERFVRGDVSRNSDGSGLGLNIAKSLMEVQGGKLELLLDGDLFKVTLVLPLFPDGGNNA